MGLLLMVCGLVIVLYSPWAQSMLREAALGRFGSGADGTRIELASFRLRFPLNLELGGLAIVNGADTLVAARSLEADANPLGLIIGHVDLSCAHIADARFRIGGPDSSMFMTIAADSLYVGPATVRLSDMDIALSEGLIAGGRLAMVLNPDTVVKPASPPQRMTIGLHRFVLSDFTYTMRLMPSIDTLKAHIARAELNAGLVDLFEQKVALDNFTGRGLDARYIAPDSAQLAAFAPMEAALERAAAADTSVTAPWTVTIDSIAFADSRGLYTTAGYHPTPGLDFGYIQASGMSLAIHDFYNQATTVRIPIELTATERCGVTLHAAGSLDIDSIALTFRDFVLDTPAGTEADFSGKLGMGDLATDPDLPLALSIRSGFAPADLAKMFPAAAPMLAAVPSENPIELDGELDGTTGHLNISDLALRINRCVTLSADGWVGNFMDPAAIEGDVALNGRIINVTALKNELLEPSTARQINIPPLQLTGRVAMHSGVANGHLAATTGSGELRLNALWNSRATDYTLHAAATRFPVQAFMPLLGVEDVTASVDATGHGYDPFASETSLEADANVAALTFNNTRYSGITAKAKLAGGHADIHLNSDNSDADLTLDASGNLDGDTYIWTAAIDGRNLDLHALGFTPEPCTVEISADFDAEASPKTGVYRGSVVLKDLYYRQLSGTIALSDVRLHLDATDSLTNLNLTNRDFAAAFSSPCGVDSLIGSFSRTGELISRQIGSFRLDPDSLHRALPVFNLVANGGADNLVNDVLAASGMSLRRLSLDAENDSTLRLNLDALRLATATMTLDSVWFSAAQTDTILRFDAGLANQPGNLDQWHRVRLDGALHGNRAHIAVNQQNLEQKTGFDIGADLTALPDTTFVLTIKPTDPTIGYQPWTVNDSNFLSLNIPHREIQANLRMRGGNSALAIFTERPTMSTDTIAGIQPVGGDLVVQLTDIHIQDWIAFNPWAPPMKGDVSADMRLNRLENSLVGHGSAGITNFTYGRDRVADFKADFDVSADRTGTLRANAALLVDGVKTITVRGALNDSTAASPFDLDFSMIRFPLATVNPFMPAGTAKLSGMLNGSLAITGSTEQPVLNGWLDFDSTAVKVAMLGTSYSVSEDSIPVRNNVVDLSGFAITACNDNPLTIDGTVDLTDLANAAFDLRLAANGTQIVNSRRAARGADVFGKAFIDLDAKIRGNMQFMSVDAALTILPETNVTYVLAATGSQIVNRSAGDMVKFVNFTDSLAVARADSLEQQGMMMLVDASLTIDDGSIINVDLDTEGKNKVQLESNGRLTFSMTPMNSGRLTGRINIDKGFARYGMAPVLSEQTFNFQRGSYVGFSGDIMNPNLNIHAINIVKANVTQSGANSRLVNFDVGLSVTGSLEHMNVAFDLSTDDDISVANELTSMSPDQRANQAMNLMLYHVYTGPGTKANSSLSSPLYSFLAGQLNEWAANTIKGVDVSFGIDQYDRTVGGNTSQTMSYSYQVSKSLFNDRFKIVVGGNYSTDANADENFSQNLINDISFEYFLNRTRSMYVRLFRHTGYESILEGEITQTGVGFVYRRKLQRVGDMFLSPGRVRRRQERENQRLEAEEAEHKTDREQ